MVTGLPVPVETSSNALPLYDPEEPSTNWLIVIVPPVVAFVEVSSVRFPATPVNVMTCV